MADRSANTVHETRFRTPAVVLHQPVVEQHRFEGMDGWTPGRRDRNGRHCWLYSPAHNHAVVLESHEKRCVDTKQIVTDSGIVIGTV